MRVLVFSKNGDYIKMLKRLCKGINSKIYVEQVEYDQLTNIALTGSNHLYVIDDRLYESFDKEYLDVLAKLQVEVIVLLRNMENIKRYMSLNIVDYFVSPFSWERVEICLKDVYRRFEILMKLNSRSYVNNKFVIKNRTEAYMIDYRSILFFEKSNKSVIIHTKDGCFKTTQSLKSIEEMVPEYHFRVHNSYIVNFDMISKIKEVSNRTYNIEFEGYEFKAVMSRYKAEGFLNDALGKHRLSYALDSAVKGEG